MSTPVSTPVDVARQRDARPGLALLLAILAVPGSTFAWELPAGGLWIGLPLAVVAIIVGIAARRRGAGRTQATAAIVIASIMLAFMGTWLVVALVS